ncbi:MAG: hypothetical protein U5J64_02285 [Halobacteriales archaeon]|nr:hypothetical protein [Halobacteriales archaeon]
MSGQEERRIVLADESEIHDEPQIAGTRVTVRQVHERVEEDGLRPETVADRLNHSGSDYTRYTEVSA